MTFQIIYSKRRTVALVVNTEGQVIVRAPKRAPLSFIQKLVEQREDWIKKALEYQLKRQQVRKQFAEGEMFLYLGQQYALHILENVSKKVIFNNAFYISRYSLPQAKTLFVHWYKKEAKRIIFERAEQYARIMNVRFNKISIRNTSSRWGSCSAAGNLNFCFRLIMAPMEIIDYVIIHELAHLEHKNHSKSFWNFVGRFYPTYKQARLWLKRYGYTLNF